MKILLTIPLFALASCSGLSLSVTAETPYGNFGYEAPSVEPTK